jgi:hypothetical protein
MRRYLKSTVVLAMLGLAFGGLYRYLFDRPDEAEFVNYLRSSLHGAGITLAAWAVQLYFTSRGSAWVRRWPLVVELLIRSVVMALAVATVTIALEAILYPYGVAGRWLVSDFPFIVAIAFALSILIGAIYELVRIHAGPVVISECGDSRRQVAYFGDTVNVAARLQAHCKEAGRRLLVSGALVRLLPEGTDVLVEPLGPTELRGRAAPIEVFAVARRRAAEAGTGAG